MLIGSCGQLSHEAGQGLKSIVGQALENGSGVIAVNNSKGQVVIITNKLPIKDWDRSDFAGRVFVGSNLKKLKQYVTRLFCLV